jgi:uncharacterized protein YkwD
MFKPQLSIFNLVESILRGKKSLVFLPFIIGLFLGSCNSFAKSVLEEPKSISTVDSNSQLIAASSMEKLVHQQVNAYRKSLNLPALKLDETISQQARIHSQAMADGKVPFSHDGFENRVKTISRKISYSSAAENVAYNQGYSDPVTVAVQGWIKSNGHRQNMQGNYNLTGIGIAKNSKGEYYFTQVFMLSR